MFSTTNFANVHKTSVVMPISTLTVSVAAIFGGDNARVNEANVNET
jgi:hypothetical protein